MKLRNITPHQKDALLTVLRRSIREGSGWYGWVTGRDSGAPAALEHLYLKGWLDRVTTFGPRGGAYYEYRLTEAAGQTVMQRGWL